MIKASPADVPKLVALMSEFYSEAGYKLNPQRAAEAFATLLSDEKLGFVWFIRSKSEDVGYLVLTLCYSMEFGGTNAYIDDFYVKPAFRGAGLGTAALGELRAFCNERGYRAVHVETGRENAAALAVYRRVGFGEIDRALLTLPLEIPAHDI
jgi:ribosomal protein S18 acetylase RimI-like enzyme